MLNFLILSEVDDQVYQPIQKHFVLVEALKGAQAESPAPELREFVITGKFM